MLEREDAGAGAPSAAYGGSGGATSTGGSGGRGFGESGGSTGGTFPARGGGPPAVGGASGRAGLGGRSGGGGSAGKGGGELGGEGGGPTELPSDLTRDILSTALVVDTANRHGVATIVLAPSASTAASFEIGDLTIESVELDAAPLDFVDAGDRLDIAVPPSMQPLSLVIRYRYEFHYGMDGVDSDNFTFTWPNLCGNVFPCHSDPSDGMTFSLSLTGTMEDLVHADEIEIAAPSYMLAWIEGPFGETSLGTTLAGTEVVFFYDQDAVTGYIDALNGTLHLVDAFDWYEQTLGPYPFGKKIGPVPTRWPTNGMAGMEHHPFWHVSPRSLDDELVQLHEAAHGWFGNGVRIRCWGELVLSEGLASYLSARALEAVGETDAAEAAYTEQETELDEYRGASELKQSWRPDCGGDALEVVRDELTYARGMLFFRALEQKVGKSALDQALAAFYAEYVGKSAGLEDLFGAVFEASGYDATSCAKAWLASSTLPDYVPCE